MKLFTVYVILCYFMDSLTWNTDRGIGGFFHTFILFILLRRTFVYIRNDVFNS